MDAVMMSDCPPRKEASSDEDIENTKQTPSISVKEQDIENDKMGFTGIIADFVICPVCRVKLKDMDALMMHSCSDIKEINYVSIANKKLNSFSVSGEQEVENDRSEFAETLEDYLICPKCYEKVKDTDAVMMHDCPNEKASFEESLEDKKEFHYFLGKRKEKLITIKVVSPKSQQISEDKAVENNRSEFSGTLQGSLICPQLEKKLNSTDAAMMHARYDREVQSNENILNKRRSDEEQDIDHNRNKLGETLEDSAVCLRCDKNTDARTIHSSFDRKGGKYVENILNRKGWYCLTGKEQEIDNERRGFVGTPSESSMSPEHHEILKNMDSMMIRDCSDRKLISDEDIVNTKNIPSISIEQDIANDKNRFMIFPPDSMNYPKSLEILKGMDVVRMHDCSTRNQMSSNEVIGNTKDILSNSVQDIDNDQRRFVGILTDFVICPVCHAKLKDMDALIMHSCSDI